VVGLLTGHCQLKGHLFKLGLTDDPTCESCLQEDESATHILCDCEAIAYLIFRHLGQFFMELSDFYYAPIIKVQHLIRSVGLIKGLAIGVAQKIIEGHGAGASFMIHPLHIHAYIHTVVVRFAL
jgi:hypothetical protein